ncbi:hypothetical protein Mgra_00005327, partial [Meloidogyne graminicola]
GLNKVNEDKGHAKFRQEIENKYKGKSGYVCVPYNGESKMYCNCVIKGKIPENFNMPNPDMECSENFFKIAMSSYFNDMNPKNVLKDNKHKKILILLDACATCKDGGIITGLRITHYEEGAGIFSKCSEEKEYEDFNVSNLKIQIPPTNEVNTNTASFTIPAILTHRICDSIFFVTNPEDKYIELKLHIEYNCQGKGKTSKIINLPSIDVNDFNNRVAEMRGLWINLDDGNIKQYVRKNLDYSIEDKIATKWTNPRLDCWTKNEICKENELN